MVHTLDVVFLKPLFLLSQHLVGMVDAALHQSRGHHGDLGADHERLDDRLVIGPLPDGPDGL